MSSTNRRNQKKSPDVSGHSLKKMNHDHVNHSIMFDSSTESDSSCSSSHSSLTGNNNSLDDAVERFFTQLWRSHQDGGLIDDVALHGTQRVVQNATDALLAHVQRSAAFITPEEGEKMQRGMMERQLCVSRAVHTILLHMRQELLARVGPLPASYGLMDTALVTELFLSPRVTGAPTNEENVGLKSLLQLFQPAQDLGVTAKVKKNDRATQTIQKGVGATHSMKSACFTPLPLGEMRAVALAQAIPLTVMSSVGFEPFHVFAPTKTPRPALSPATLQCEHRGFTLRTRVTTEAKVFIRYDDIEMLYMGLPESIVKFLHTSKDHENDTRSGRNENDNESSTSFNNVNNDLVLDSTLLAQTDRYISLLLTRQHEKEKLVLSSRTLVFRFDSYDDLNNFLAVYQCQRPQELLEEPPLEFSQRAKLSTTTVSPHGKGNGSVCFQEDEFCDVLNADEANLCQRIDLLPMYYIQLRESLRVAAEGKRAWISWVELAAVVPSCDIGRLKEVMKFFEEKGWARPHRFYRQRA